MRAGALIAPRQAMDAPRHGPSQEPVPRRIKLDLINAMTKPIVREQPGLVTFGATAVIAGLLAASDLAGLADTVDPPFAALAHQRLVQGNIGVQQTDRLQRRNLVENLAGWV